jgi:hypothetical protein
MTNCFRKLEPSKTEYDLAAYEEGTYVRNHSFRNMDCTTNLQRSFAYKKISCARTKSKSVVSNVYASLAFEELKNDLKSVNFVAVSWQTYHKHMKQVTILLRYFRTFYKTDGRGFDFRL